jgi:hypothetical protein
VRNLLIERTRVDYQSVGCVWVPYDHGDDDSDLIDGDVLLLSPEYMPEDLAAEVCAGVLASDCYCQWLRIPLGSSVS